MSQYKEILLIEDEDVGESYVDLLQNYNPSWNVTWVRTISEVQNYYDLNRLHIFIFDQRLGPNELGTDAFNYVHQKNPRVQGIMLSGVALAQDYEKARKIAGNNIQYLNKEDVLDLPQKVNSALEKYYVSLPKIEDNIDLGKGFPFQLFSKRPKIRLLSHYVIDENFVFEDKWKIDVKIRSGENIKLLETKKKYAKTAIVTELDASFSNEFGISNNNFVKQALEKRFSFKTSSNTETGVEVINQDERTYSLSPEQNGEDVVQVNYEYNDVYTKIRAHVSVKCPLCLGTQYVDYDVYVPQNRVFERRVVYNASMGKQVIELSK